MLVIGLTADIVFQSRVVFEGIDIRPLLAEVRVTDSVAGVQRSLVAIPVRTLQLLIRVPRAFFRLDTPALRGTTTAAELASSQSTTESALS